MNFSEFKGFIEGIELSFADGHPTAEQWQQIRNKMANVRPETQYYPVHPQPQIQPPKFTSPPPFLPWTATGGAQ